MNTTNWNINIKTLPQSEIELTGVIPVSDIEPFRKKAIAHLREHIHLDGFRKGKVPEEMLVQKIGEVAVLEEAAEIAFKETIPEIFAEKNIRSIGRPEVMITKLAPKEPIEFKIKIAVVPVIKHADYKKIAKDVMAKKDEPLEVTEKEIEEVVENIRKAQSKNAGKSTDEVLPEVNDEFVKKIGNFENVADFKEKIKANLIEEKKHRAKEKKRIEIGGSLVKETSFEIPEVLVKSELEKMWSRFEQDIARFNISVPDYLKHVKKDKETLLKEWRPDAEKSARLEMILLDISGKEKIVPDESAVKAEVKHLMEHHKDADPDRARIYVETILTNEAVFAFLESQR